MSNSLQVGPSWLGELCCVGCKENIWKQRVTKQSLARPNNYQTNSLLKKNQIAFMPKLSPTHQICLTSEMSSMQSTPSVCNIQSTLKMQWHNELYLLRTLRVGVMISGFKSTLLTFMTTDHSLITLLLWEMLCWSETHFQTICLCMQTRDPNWRLDHIVATPGLLSCHEPIPAEWEILIITGHQIPGDGAGGRITVILTTLFNIKA